MKGLKRNPQLRTELYAELTRPATGSQALTLNYRWEQKDGKERAYIELILGKEQRDEHCIRVYYVKITRDLSEVQQLVQEAARTVRPELEKIIGDEDRENEIIKNETGGKLPIRLPITFQGYYLKGERQEYDLGKTE